MSYMSRKRRTVRQGVGPSEGVKSLCDLFPPEFAQACGPYCWACGDRHAVDGGHSDGMGSGVGHRKAHHGMMEHDYHHGHHVHEDDWPYIWDLEENCQCR